MIGLVKAFLYRNREQKRLVSLGKQVAEHLPDPNNFLRPSEKDIQYSANSLNISPADAKKALEYFTWNN